MKIFEGFIDEILAEHPCDVARMLGIECDRFSDCSDCASESEAAIFRIAREWANRERREVRKVAKCDKITMEVIEVYNSELEAAKANNKPLETIKDACRRKTVSIGKYVYRFRDEVDEKETYEGKRNRPVLVVDAETKKARVFLTRAEAAKALCYCDATVFDAIYKKKPLGGRYIIKYAR